MLINVDYDTWKLYLFLEHQYQPVSSFLLTAAILVYPYVQIKHCLCTRNKNQHALMLFNGNRFRHTASSAQEIKSKNEWKYAN